MGTEKEKFIKHDDGKLRYSLVPPEVIEEMAKIITHGANKYGKDNWKKAPDTERFLDALFRHIEAYRMGEELDKDSGYSHLSHAITNLAFMIYFNKKGK